MMLAHLRQSLTATPFVPFRVQLAEQKALDVPHPAWVWLLPGGTSIAVAEGDGSAHFIHLVHVTRLEVSPRRLRRRVASNGVGSRACGGARTGLRACCGVVQALFLPPG